MAYYWSNTPVRRSGIRIPHPWIIITSCDTVTLSLKKQRMQGESVRLRRKGRKTSILCPVRGITPKEAAESGSEGNIIWLSLRHPCLPPSPSGVEGKASIEARLLHPALDSCPEEQSEHGQEKERHDQLISGRVSLETSGFDVTLFPGCGIWISYA